MGEQRGSFVLLARSGAVEQAGFGFVASPLIAGNRAF
jgi:hypothetical protein